MIKRFDNFWIRFAGLYCRVTATPGIKAIIHKYFSGSYVSVSDHGPKLLAHIAELTIRQKQTAFGRTSVVITNNQLQYFMFIEGTPHLYYPLLSGVLQRIFIALFYNTNGLVFHASAVESQGKAHVFVGDSGTGKTTVARLSSDLYGLKVLADNQVFIRKRRGKYVVYPFPFTQYHKDGNNVYFPIASFYVLRKSASFAVQTLTFIESLHALGHEIQILNVNDVPFDAESQSVLRRTLFDFTKTVRMKRLYFFRGKGLWEAIISS